MSSFVEGGDYVVYVGTGVCVGWVGVAWKCVSVRAGRVGCASLSFASIGVVLNLIYSFIIVDVCIHDTAFTR